MGAGGRVVEIGSLADFIRMALSKAQRYERLSKRAGICGSACLIVWIVSLFIAAVWLSGENRAEWLGVVIGLSFIATVASNAASHSRAGAPGTSARFATRTFAILDKNALTHSLSGLGLV